MEIMISLAVLSMTTMGGISAFLLLNRYAANLKNLGEARALCQERIEQAQTLAFRPTASVLPLAPNADATTKAATPTIGIFGPTTDYNTSTGAFTAGTNVQTTTETIPIATQSDGTTVGSSSVTYTRTTTVTPAALTLSTEASGVVTSTATTLGMIQFAVNVSYVFHGTTYSMSMNTLRGPD